jgi:outer membrane receptor protein involved in Fe transport
VSTPDRREPHYTNDGSGRIYGVEVSAEAHTQSNGMFYLAYTLSRSERKDGPGQPYHIFEHDQTHILSLVASQPLGHGWEIGARFRLISGNPTTPVTGSIYDARSGVYVPSYGPVNSERNPLFHQLDLRVEKVWKLSPVTLAAYLDVLNVYNAQPRDGLRYSYDYSKSEAVGGMPLFPSLGLRGEL